MRELHIRKGQSAVATNSRSFRKSHAANIDAQVLHRLNEIPPSSESKRVAEVILLAQDASSLEHELVCVKERYPKGWRSVEPRTTLFKLLFRKQTYFLDTEFEAKNQKLSSTLEELNKRLRRYHWSPLLLTFQPGTDFCVYFNVSPSDLDARWENYAVLTITLLAQHGLLDRVRRCLECDRWFYAVVDHHKHCSPNCRKRNSSHNPEFKEKRRLYMAKHRREEKQQYAIALAKARKNAVRG